ncbi:uncharacterized protein LOC103572268 [Microplitis demolitor]|uniref:uncharacterized protein LOC103572268 n=1 Tax=Microplitis demolitor TaxID=69319 RepID=UPI0004CDA76D|nr:uncharacterized protein LOC103572268 [Microplitis demolitor]
MTPVLSSMLDRTKTSNRNATLIVAATSVSLKQDLSKASVSKDTIRRSRQKHRADTFKYIKDSFKPDTCLTVHWDSKLMRTTTSSQTEDRLAVLVTGEGVTTLLNIPIIDRASGINQATAIYNTFLEWNISDQVRSLCFDTTASNTELHEGAAVHLETMLKKKMLHFACRHHILELILTATFSSQFEPVISGPQTKLFERFKKEWPKLDKKKLNVETLKIK